MPPSLLTLVVSGQRFYHERDESTLEALKRNIDRCDQPMQQLVDRFALAGKSVLSIGAGLAHEEYTLWRAGCRLTLVDIDDFGTLAPMLTPLVAPADASSSDLIRYVIGDGRELISATDEKFQVCYFSSLTPDELRRKQIQERSFLTRRLPFINSIAARLIGHGLFKTWPADKEPFGDIVESATRKLLADGGLFIHQSYAYGVDVLTNPHWVGLVRRQLRSWGVELVAFYSFLPQGYVTLAVGFKGSPREAQRYVDSIATNPDIQNFHGRSVVPHTIRRWVP